MSIMIRLQMLGFTAACALVLAACATDEQKAREAGAIQLSQSEIANVFPGNTIKGEGPGGQFINYYHEDGRKLNKEADQVSERKWWINDSGQWCETLVEDERQESCDLRLYKDGHGLTRYSENGVVMGSFSLIVGDREGFSLPYPEIRPANNPKQPAVDKLPEE